MNKTININLGGVFFHIDELAYQKLKLYLDAIRRSLSDDPQGRDEILNDIENRLGELLTERIKDVRQVVNENDIDEITKIMGKPEDYLVDEEIFEDEPVYRSRAAKRRLFRDPDDKFIGGVCSGIGHYLGVDAIWIRIFCLILLFGFGIGFIIYPILWIIIPEAQTTADKLQMKGEPVNIDNIEKKIREEFRDMGERVNSGVNDVADKVKDSEFRRKATNTAKSGLQEVIDVLGTIFSAIFKFLGKFIGVILIIVGAASVIGIVIAGLSWAGLGISGFEPHFINEPTFFYDSILPVWLIVIFTLIAVAIPFIFLFWLGLRIVSSNVGPMSTATKSSLIGIWIVALLGIGFSAINFSSRNAYLGVSTETEELSVVKSDTLNIRMVSDEDLSYYKELRRRYDNEIVYDGNMEKIYSNRINVDIKHTDKVNAYVKVRKESRGKSRLTANRAAEAIEYEFNLTNSDLLLNGYFLSNMENKYKDLLVDITIYLPENSFIYLDQTTRSFLNDVKNIQNIYDRDMPENYYKMTNKGLKCIDCNSDIFSEKYKEEHDNFKLKIDDEGVEINIRDDNEKAKIKIDDNGILIGS